MARSKEDIREYQQEYRDTHKKQRQEYDKLRYSENEEFFHDKNYNYYLEHQQEIKDKSNIYYQENKDLVRVSHRIYVNSKRKSDVNFNLRSQISKSINRVLKINGVTKNGSILQYLPYTMQELKDHLEKQFEPWMTWQNWGPYDKSRWNDNDVTTWTWQIDHIIPHSVFRYSSMTDDSFTECWALSNLRPLNAKQNLVEGNRR